jgi:hypothetical protein
MYKNLISNILVFWIIGSCPALWAADLSPFDANPYTTEISSPTKLIGVKEPIIIKITHRFKNPQFSSSKGKILPSVPNEEFILIEMKDKNWQPKFSRAKKIRSDAGTEYFMYPLFSQLVLEDSKGLIYSNYFVFQYNLIKNDYIFPEPGKYKILVPPTQGIPSDINALEIEVQPSALPYSSSSILTNKYDYDFLAGLLSQIFEDPNYRIGALERLESLVKQNQSTLLEKWAAARLGLEYYREYDDNRVKALQEKKECPTELLDKAEGFLIKSTSLPDDFPERQVVYLRLAEISMRKNEFTKATGYLDEIKSKYPNGAVGAMVERRKEEIIKLQENSKK